MFRTRLHALWLLRSGRRMGEVASVVGVHYRTLQKWVSWYREGGVEEVLSHRMKGLGQPRFLREDQERKLTEEAASGRFRTGGEIREWIESEYGVSYRLGSVYSLLSRLGCSPRVPRGLHEKADPRPQSQFIQSGHLCWSSTPRWYTFSPPQWSVIRPPLTPIYLLASIVASRPPFQ